MTASQLENFQKSNSIKTDAIDARLDFIQDYLSSRGIESGRSTSYNMLNTKFGNSGYVSSVIGADRRFKIRVSDHATGSRRVTEEIMFQYTDEMDYIHERLEMAFNADRYETEIVVREEINTEKGINGIFKNATIEMIEEAVKVSKKGNVMNRYRVTYTKKVFK